MSLRFLSSLMLLCGLRFGLAAFGGTPLRICADPDNLPFSNRSGTGFDERIAVLVARDLHRTPVFVWARSRRGFLREQFNKNACDVLLGVPEHGCVSLSTTTPYYTSSYVFVTPRSASTCNCILSPIQHSTIGASACRFWRRTSRRHRFRSSDGGTPVRSLALILRQREGDVVRAVADGQVGVAVVWGPVAGYFAAQLRYRSRLSPIPRHTTGSRGIPFTFGIGLGVHKKDHAL